VQIRLLTEADDVEADLDLRRRAFGPITAQTRPAWVHSVRYSMDSGHMVGVFDGGQLLGTARYHPMRQWWHGRSLPMAGVAGVKVAPEERGRGTGRAMMARLLAEIAAAGYPVAALYPTTAPVYRSCGFEFAGFKYETTVPAHELSRLVARGGEPAAAGLRRATPDDGELIVAIKGRLHEQLRDCGPNTREPWQLREWLDDQDHFAYVADDGFLSYRWAGGQTDEVDVEEVTAGSAATALAFWQILAGHASMAHTVRACLAPDDPIAWLTKDPVAQLRTRDAWMLRVVDAPAAIAGRGYPSAVSVMADLELSDAALPANAGRWTLTISDGKGELAPQNGGAVQAPLVLDEHGLAALYAGVPLATLRRARLASGGDAGLDDALDSAFRGPAFMVDYF